MTSRGRLLPPSASRRQVVKDLFQGRIADAFLPDSEASINSGLRMSAPQDTDAAPTEDTGQPSCGLCPDTNVPPAGHCREGWSDECPATSGDCPPPDTVRGCFTTNEGCPPDSSDCYSTQHCAETVANCGPFTECASSVDNVRCILPPD